ncbi:MAG: hypothetical protein JSS27_19080 [Planctomycetes bacterium]|nr:hypothetical protein [Planctomycetota bacterium]
MQKLLLRTIVVLIALVPVAARAESWAFGPSFYSHSAPAQPQWVVPSRGPFYTQPPGFYVRSGYRNVRGFINVGGQSFEQMNVWESWVQPGSARF